MCEERFSFGSWTKYPTLRIIDNEKGVEFDTTESCKLLNNLQKENTELKEEVELLREGLKAYEGNLPAYLDCAEICDFNADLLEFRRKRQKFYNEHPNRCKIIVDGVELK